MNTNQSPKVSTKVSAVCDREFTVKVDGKVAGRVFRSNVSWDATGRYQGFANCESFEAAVAAVVSFL